MKVRFRSCGQPYCISQAHLLSIAPVLTPLRPKEPLSRNLQQGSLTSFRCRAAASPPPLLQWAIEAAEDPDITVRLASLTAIDLAIALFLATSFVNTYSSRTRQRLILEDYLKPETSGDGLGGAWGRFSSFISKSADSVPTGASVLVLAEQEAVMTEEEGAIEECLVDGIDNDKDLATSFLLLFITAIKRTWLANLMSEAIMTCCHRQQFSLSAASVLLKRVSNPKANFKAPLGTLMVNGELMEAITIYSLVIVMKAKRLFTWIDSMKAMY